MCAWVRVRGALGGEHGDDGLQRQVLKAIVTLSLKFSAASWFYCSCRSRQGRRGLPFHRRCDTLRVHQPAVAVKGRGRLVERGSDRYILLHVVVKTGGGEDGRVELYSTYGFVSCRGTIVAMVVCEHAKARINPERSRLRAS